jgi:polar amino acid transport system permease protein
MSLHLSPVPPENNPDVALEPEPVFESDSESLSRQTRFLLWARDVPWWSIALIIGIIAFGFYTLADKQYRNILRELLDSPSLTTDELFDVTYLRKTEVLLVKEEYVLKNLQDETITVTKTDVLSEIKGVLECPPDASENCLSQRGIIVTYRDFRVPEGVTPTNYAEVEGVIKPKGGFGVNTPGKETVTLVDGNNLFVDEANILERGDGEDYVLPCNRILDANCKDIVGQYVRFRQGYIENTALRKRVDVTIRHLDDGYQRVIRPTVILSRREGTLPCFTDENCAEVPVTYVIYQEKIVGIEIDNGDGKRVVRDIEQQTKYIPAEQIIDKQANVMVECNKKADPRCQNFVGAIITMEGETFEGQLTLESNTAYKIVLEGDSEATEFQRIDLALEERTPLECTPDTEDVDCKIKVTLKPETVGGRILKEDDKGILLEIVPEKIITLKESEIYKEQSRTPAACALNNPRGCDAGIWLTISVTLIAYASALFVGLFMGLFRASSQTFIKNAASFYIELIRGVPLLVLLLYFAFVIGPSIRESTFILFAPLRFIFSQVNQIEVLILGQESFIAEATIGLAIGYSAFMAEIFRAGIESIHKGQMEAARSLGMSYPQSMRHVILPQAIRVVLPPLGNEFIAILKDSALISVLALPDLLQQGRLIVARDFQALPAYTMVAWVYVVMTFILSLGVRTLEKRSRLPR